MSLLLSLNNYLSDLDLVVLEQLHLEFVKLLQAGHRDIKKSCYNDRASGCNAKACSVFVKRMASSINRCI